VRNKNRFNPDGLVQEYTFPPIFMQKFKKVPPGSYGLMNPVDLTVRAYGGPLCKNEMWKKKFYFYF